jgi:hypothetical protein
VPAPAPPSPRPNFFDNQAGAYQLAKIYDEKVPAGSNALEDKTNTYKSLVTQYRAKANGIWQRSHKKDVNTTVPILPMQSQCKKLKDGQSLTVYDRLAVILSPKITRVTIFPPMNGNENLLQRCMEYIRTKDDPRTVFLFSPGIFNPDPQAQANNAKILSALLSIQSDDNGLKSSIFILSQNTAEEAKIGCDLTGSETDSVALVNLLGPTYVIFPMACKVEEKSRKDGKEETNNRTIGGLLITGATAQEPDIPACKLANVTRGVRDFIATGGLTRNEPYMTVAFPPNIKSPENLNSAHPYKVFNVQKSNPAFTFSKGQSDDMEERMLRFKVKDPESPEGYFLPVPESSLALQGIMKHLVNGRYEIREPHPDVLNDWRQLKFTTSELAFLKDLNIDEPDMLSEIFDTQNDDDSPGGSEEGWRERLADFMGDVATNCRTETQQMMSAECSNIREFLDEVNAYRTFVRPNPVIAEKEFLQDGELDEQFKRLQMEKGTLEDDIFDLQSQLSRQGKKQQELQRDMEKTPFEEKYFQGDYPTIPNLWPEKGPLMDKKESIQGDRTTIIGSPYIYNPKGDALPQGKSVLCEKIAATQIEKGETGTFKLSKTEYIADLCALMDNTASGSNKKVLYDVFKELVKNFPGWYFRYK